MLESLLARSRVLICSCVVVGAGVLFVHPTWAQALGVDVWNVPALEKKVRASADERDWLSNEDGEVLHRIAIKESIITELIQERTTLAEATERFLALNAAHPNYLEALRNSFPGATDYEKYARNVISFAVPRVAPHERDALSSRLEAELQQMLAAGPTN